MDNFQIEMGTRMKLARKELHLTQEDMAEKLGVSVKHYSGIERGVAGISLETLVNVSNILNVSLDYLVKGNIMSENYIPSRLVELYLQYPPQKRTEIIRLLELIEHLH